MKFQAKVLLLAIVLLSWLTSSAAPAAAAPEVSPEQLAAQIVAEINAYRQANGFSALPVNASLAYLAKTQSEYQASIQSITHTGPGGTTPKERAAAYGYAGGGTFFMSEIIYGGHGATPASAIGWWKNSALHNSVLLDKRYAELGAGVAYSGERVYFTVELAWTGSYIAYDGVGGDSAGNVNTGTSPSGSGSGSESGSDSNTPDETIPDVVTAPVSRAEANPDGSVVHIVQAGQDLWTIAVVYEVNLQDIYQLNGMSPGDFIFPGDEIIIQPPTTPPTATSTNTPEYTATPLPPTATKVPEIGEAFSYAPAASAVPNPTLPVAAEPDQPAAVQQAGDRTALGIIIASGVIILAAVVGSMLMQRP
ncbi:MAG: CAP domain-containing protein, partial [Chloroflexota bacterium]